MKSYPKKGDQDYDAFINQELDKLEMGVTINGVYISNWLYWHINYWKAYIPTFDVRRGEVIDQFLHPQLRDNEWMVAEHLQQAKEEQKGLLLVGGRRIAKTTWVASWLALGGTIYEGSQNIIVGNNKEDISNITIQMDKGLANVEPFLRYDKLLKDWTNLVALGWEEKRKGGSRLEWSRFYIRNTSEGKATEILAGLTPKTLVYDEIGKAMMKESFLASIKSFASPFGWRCVPILTGTGGDFTKGKDAEEMFHNPDRFNLLALEVPGEERKTAVFISGIYAVDYPKKEQPLSEYLNKEKGSELDSLMIHVTQPELANAMIDADLEKWAKAHNQLEYLKAKMYSPRTVDEVFLSNLDENPYPVEALKQHLDFIQRRELQPEYVKLYRDASTNKVCYTTETKLKPVFDFPVNKDTIKDACVVLYEPPITGEIPDFLYIAGADPYDKDASITSPSLGCILIFKRMYDPINGTYQRRIVASYTARPETMRHWHETAEMLMELYNAKCMIEYSGTNFVQYMDGKNKAHWLADGYNLGKEILGKNMKIMGKIKGLPATTPVQRHYGNLIIDYLQEPLTIGMKDNGEPIEVMGLTRIDDPMLLTELINYRPKEGNYDRRVAFGHILVYDEYLQKISPNVKMEEKEEPKIYKPKIYSPFTLDTKSESPTLRNPFWL